MVSRSPKVKPRRKRRVIKEAVKVEEELLRDYELVLIISPEVGEEKSKAILKSIDQFIVGSGGATSNVEQWGKRQLAYQIGHFTEGNYVLTRFKMKKTAGRELEAKINIAEDVLRHLLIRLDS